MSSFDNNGIDSILCGSFYDYGYSHDGNFAPGIHHRLFETQISSGYTWRNDLVSINICRGREHGIQSYNAYRAYCNFTKATNFDDFRDTMSRDDTKRLKKLYKFVNFLVQYKS